MLISQALKHGWPLYLVTLVNKMASMVVSLLPAMLVARALSTEAAAVAVGLVRSASILGTLLSGPLGDVFGLRPLLVTSLLLSGVGAAAMAQAETLEVLVAGAFVAQIGMGMFPTAVRLLLTRMVPLEHQREALGWQRTVSNGGLLVSFSIAAVLGGGQTHALLVLDASASILASLLAFGLLGEGSERPQTAGGEGRAASGSAWGFAWFTAILCGWQLLYEGYLTASSALLQRTWGDGGVSLYSSSLVINTVLCASLGISTARRISDPRWSVPAGLMLLAAGAMCGLWRPDERAFVLGGMVIATVGELVFTAAGHFVWMALLPDGPRRGTVFSLANTATAAARALGAALAWPLVIDSGHPALGIALIGVVVLLVALPVVGWKGLR